ncbi:Hypothetical_protein [Hexamita inflata]|uniref:Hypothetical_protein n=1 Tax=Hexamita inflata TaxID=28002 RepID=A0ABP1J0A6_9EUKA
MNPHTARFLDSARQKPGNWQASNSQICLIQLYIITGTCSCLLSRRFEMYQKSEKILKTPKQHCSLNFIKRVKKKSQNIHLLHYLACKGGAISLIREQVNSLIREFHHAKLPYKQVTNIMRFNPVFNNKSFKFNIFPRYILDTFLLIRELKSVTPLQASKHLPYKQGYVVQLNLKFVNEDFIKVFIFVHVIILQCQQQQHKIHYYMIYQYSIFQHQHFRLG